MDDTLGFAFAILACIYVHNCDRKVSQYLCPRKSYLYLLKCFTAFHKSRRVVCVVAASGGDRLGYVTGNVADTPYGRYRLRFRGVVGPKAGRKPREPRVLLVF